jgi:hypothetical protein
MTKSQILVIEFIQQHQSWFFVALLVVVFAVPLWEALEWCKDEEEDEYEW